MSGRVQPQEAKIAAAGKKLAPEGVERLLVLLMDLAQERGACGRMLVLIVRDDRPKPENVEKMNDQQRIDLFRSMTAYGGTYTFDGKRVEHHIDISWNEVWTGTTVVREITKDGDKLVYTSPAAPFASDGKMSEVTLVWEKVK